MSLQHGVTCQIVSRGSVCRLTHVARSDDLLAPAHDERGLTALTRSPEFGPVAELVTTLEVFEATNRFASWSRAAGSPIQVYAAPIEADEATRR